MATQSFDVVIIGGGPAGASAATFTARAGLTTAVIDADKGITRRAMLNNHLGFPDGITGPELVDRGRAQAERAGATWIHGSAVGLSPIGDGFDVTVDDGSSDVTVVHATDVVLATGMSTTLAAAAGVETTDGTEPRVSTIVSTDPQGRTTLPGVWAAGTVAGTSVHTIVTAGDGARVAINLVSARRGERYVDHDVLPAS